MLIFFFSRSFNLLLRDSAKGSQLIDEREAGKKGGDSFPEDEALKMRLELGQCGAPTPVQNPQ